ncbi:MAG: hypothetical protein ACI4DO_06330 [Roseburia sp.]
MLNHQAVASYHNINEYKNTYKALFRLCQGNRQYYMPTYIMAEYICEQYLKLLLRGQSTKKVQEKDLKSLFDMLPKKHQAGIEKLTCGFYRRWTGESLDFALQMEEAGREVVFLFRPRLFFMDSMVKALSMMNQICL